MANCWKQQWRVPSDSNPTQAYTVSLKQDGSYACACARWKFARAPKPDCHHIEQVKGGNFDDPEAPSDAPEPDTPAPPQVRVVLCHVRGVTPVVDSGGRVTEVHTPLIPFGDPYFTLTVVYDLLKAGVSWATVNKRYHLREMRLTRSQVEDYVRRYGRKLYGPLNKTSGNYPVEVPQGYEGFEIVEAL